MIVAIAFLIILAAAGVAAHAQPRRWPAIVRWGVLAGAAVVLALYAWRTAFPSGSVDFDTWAELARWKLGRVHELTKRHRPVQYLLEYCVVLGGRPAGFDEQQVRAALVALSLAVSLLVASAFRRQLFGSASMAGPLIWGFGFALTPAGVFLCDSWNDHMILVPFYLAGVGVLAGWGRRPALAAAGAVVVFAVESLFHSAEPWLWASAVPLAAVLCLHRRRVSLLLGAVALAGMAAVSFGIVQSFPGGSGAAGAYVSMFARRGELAETLRVFAAANAVGGLGEIRARLLFPALVAALVMLLLLGGRRRWKREALFGWLVAVAAVFPLAYETDNPERFYTLAVLWPLVGAQAILRSGEWRRLWCRRGVPAGAKRYLPALPALVLAVAFVLSSAANAGRAAAVINETHVYNMYGELLRERLDPSGTLVVAPEGSFYLWMECCFPGRVRVLETGERADEIVSSESRGGGVVYINDAVAKGLTPTMRSRARKVFERPGDPATVVYRMEK